MTFDAHRTLSTAGLAAGLALLSGCNAMGVARDPVTPQRPTISDNTQTSGFGTFEVEAGLELDPRDRTSVETRVSVGLSENSEFFLGWSPFTDIDKGGVEERGPGDLLVGWKQRLMDETEELPATAVQISTSLPVGADEPFISSGETDFFGAFIADRTYGRLGVTGFYQLGLLGNAELGNTDIEHTVAVVGSWAHDDWWTFGLETALVGEPEADEEPLLATLFGQYKMSEYMTVDGGLRIGLNEDADDAILFIGVTTNLGRYF